MSLLIEVFRNTPAGRGCLALTKNVLDYVCDRQGDFDIRFISFPSKEAEERIAFGRNEEASEIMKSAQGSYERGYYTEALDQYQDVLMRYRDSIYADEALDEIVRINEEMKEFQGKPKITMRGSQANTGVIIQLLSENTFLFSLGSEDNIKAGEVLQLYRKEGSSLVFIGSLKVTEVYPTISRGKTVYYDRQPKAGDIVSF